MKLPTGNTNTDRFTLIDGGVYANVSLRTGLLRHGLRYDAARNWGVDKWAAPLLSVVFDGASSTVDYRMRQLSSLDNTCAANIKALNALADYLNEPCDTLLSDA